VKVGDGGGGGGGVGGGGGSDVLPPPQANRNVSKLKANTDKTFDGFICKVSGTEMMALKSALHNRWLCDEEVTLHGTARWNRPSGALKSDGLASHETSSQSRRPIRSSIFAKFHARLTCLT